VGPALRVVAVPLSVLLIINYINLMTGPGLLILVGRGKLRPGVYSALLGMVLNLSLSFFLIRAYGFRGAVIGTSLSLGIASAFFLYLFQREARIPFLEIVRSAYLKPIACSLAVMTLFGLFARSEHSSWLGLVIRGGFFGVGYLLVLAFTRFFDSFDLAILKRLLPVSRIQRRVVPGA
jgi:O-antigen/teichoic acid export membrane protein